MGKKAFNTWFPGSELSSAIDPLSSKICTHFAFNSEDQGWHYAWQCHRHAHKKHELHVFLLARQKHGDPFICVSEVSSPPFSISHTRCTNKRSISAPEESPYQHKQPKIESTHQHTTAQISNSLHAYENPGVRVHPAREEVATERAGGAAAGCVALMPVDSLLLRIQQLEARRQQLQAMSPGLGLGLANNYIYPGPVIPVSQFQQPSLSQFQQPSLSQFQFQQPPVVLPAPAASTASEPDPLAILAMLC
jgi:hypothetical protein